MPKVHSRAERAREACILLPYFCGKQLLTNLEVRIRMWAYGVLMALASGMMGCSSSNTDQEKEVPRPVIPRQVTENRRTYWDENQEELKESFFVLKDSQFVKHGPYKMYSKEGVLTMEYNYHMGLPEGPVKDYYPTGELYSEYEYKGGKPNGPFTWYYPNGLVRMTGTYRNGKYSDTLREFDTTGVLKRVITEFSGIEL